MVVDGIVVFMASLAAAIANEFLAWLVIYRTDEYQRIKGVLVRTEKRLESIRNTSISNAKSKKKKEQRQEDQMKARMKELQAIKTKTMLLSTVLLFGFYQLLTRHYKGVAVASLPFQPIPLIAKVTHRGLQDDDLTQGSATFIYILCSTSLRVIVSKVFNFGFTAKMNSSLTDTWTKAFDEPEEK